MHKASEDLHACEGELPFEGDGPCISRCDECEDGTLWVTGPGRSSQVGYCPFCGYTAQVVPTLLMLRRIGIS
jgi:hypothetical protein